MSDLYLRIFNDIFSSCEPYLIRDFLNVRGINSNKVNYFLFSCRKIFEEVINVLDKNRYNGELTVYDKLYYDNNEYNIFDEVVKKSSMMQKGKIVVDSNNIIKLKNARETEIKERIILIPIDGISAFVSGNSDFSVVIALQQQNSDGFITTSLYVYNPIRRDIFLFDINEGCKYNNKKIANDVAIINNKHDVIFVNDASSKFSFDLTKLSQVSNSLVISTSIFSAIVELLTTNKNMCVYKINDEMISFVDFMCNIAMLETKRIGKHLVIEKKVNF